MKTSAIFAVAAATMAKMASAHATPQEILVNGVSQGVGNSEAGYIRKGSSANNPVLDVTGDEIRCNFSPASAAKYVPVKAGDKVTVQWHHNQGAPTGADADEPIAQSHYGPIMTYIAPDASNGAGSVWVKLAEEGLNNGKWAVDNFRANGGTHDVTIPSGLAAGKYLLRPEIIALHEASAQGKAQFYMACIQIEVSGTGSTTLPAGVAFPGAYKATDAGILHNIYPLPNAGAATYTIPGPAVWDGATGGSAPADPAPVTSTTPTPTPTPVTKPTTLSTVVKPVTSTAAPAPTKGADTPSTGSVQAWGQCGGKGYTGATACASGFKCHTYQEYYSQCIPSDATWA